MPISNVLPRRVNVTKLTGSAFNINVTLFSAFLTNIQTRILNTGVRTNIDITLLLSLNLQIRLEISSFFYSS